MFNVTTIIFTYIFKQCYKLYLQYIIFIFFTINKYNDELVLLKERLKADRRGGKKGKINRVYPALKVG